MSQKGTYQYSKTLLRKPYYTIKILQEVPSTTTSVEKTVIINFNLLATLNHEKKKKKSLFSNQGEFES